MLTSNLYVKFQGQEDKYKEQRIPSKLIIEMLVRNVIVE